MASPRRALEIRVRGRVQGVGFRPHVHRLATELGLSGEVLNDGAGVLIRVSGSADVVQALLDRLAREAPPLARVEAVEPRPYDGEIAAGFAVVASEAGMPRAEVTPDAAVCAACAAEVLDRGARRHRYPFTTCTHCGPRLSIVLGVPYDRERTTLASFPLCAPCRAEYDDVRDRRFHAEATACAACGPATRLVALTADAAAFGPISGEGDDVDAAARLLERGAIVAVKGIGGYQLACDATRADVVQRLRERKRRDAKPFAVMARDLDVIRRFAEVDAVEEAALRGADGPIVLLAARAPTALPEALAPGLRSLGFMLPTTPLHLLLLAGFDRPVVMTSGTVSDEPQVTRDDELAR
ncbi:MAG TPA: Sua5/YciO/YrdC/YwlC family protein, partial [Minicystis sp.]|nr:Sua5/YciO/YrdC/YwlC family protein [Minicystis sp.]